MAKIKDYLLLREYQKKSCIICGAESEPYHIYKNSHDLEDNLLALCRVHTARLNEQGLNALVRRYPEIAIALIEKNWKFDSTENYWCNYDLMEIDDNE